MGAELIQPVEIFKQPIYFLTIGGFPSAQSFLMFCRQNGIVKHDIGGGYPVFAVMTALYKAKTNRTVAGSLQEELTTVKIEKEKTLIAIKRRDFIDRDLAVNRIRTTLIATAQKIKYAIKLAAPRVCGLFHVPDIENVLTECYNVAIEQLEAEAETICDWETYGTQNSGTDIQQGGNELAEVTEENPSEGSGQQDSPIKQEQRTGPNRPNLNSIFGSSS